MKVIDQTSNQLLSWISLPLGCADRREIRCGKRMLTTSSLVSVVYTRPLWLNQLSDCKNCFIRANPVGCTHNIGRTQKEYRLCCAEFKDAAPHFALFCIVPQLWPLTLGVPCRNHARWWCPYNWLHICLICQSLATCISDRLGEGGRERGWGHAKASLQHHCLWAR